MGFLSFSEGDQVIVDAADSGEFPVRLFLGSDTIAVVSDKVAAVWAEVGRQRAAAVHGLDAYARCTLMLVCPRLLVHGDSFPHQQ
jgi:hypothetical protein